MKERSGCLSRQKNFILVILSLFSLQCLADGYPFLTGARGWGVANATIARSDCYALINNVAGLGGCREAVAFSSYDSYYGFDGLGTAGFGAVVPLKGDLATGFTVQRFGDKLYNELAIGVGAGHRINRFSLGVKINYLQTSVSAASLTASRKAFVVEFGGIVVLSSKLSYGAHVYNLTQSSFSGEFKERTPTVLRSGFQYRPGKSIRLSAEIEKNTVNPVSLRGGLEYELIKNVVLRTGIASRPLTNHFGAGFTSGKFHLDYAVSTHPVLGWAHHVSLGYTFKKSGDDKND